MNVRVLDVTFKLDACRNKDNALRRGGVRTLACISTAARSNIKVCYWLQPSGRVSLRGGTAR